MTTLDAVARKKEPVQASAEELAAQELVRMAKDSRPTSGFGGESC
ncbi:hypothetical protein [Nocardia sp. NPDC004604]